MKCKYCEKVCKNDNSLRNHERMCSENPEKQISNFTEYNLRKKIKCKYCEREFVYHGYNNHVEACYLNPKNKKLCEICDSPIKNYKNGVTCSYSCANKKFRSGNNHPNFLEDKNCYRTICFSVHKKECIICGEANIVAVHHLNENHEDNRPENLIPLCPTHHQYMHSGFRHLIQEKVDFYIKNLG